MQQPHEKPSFTEAQLKRLANGVHNNNLTEIDAVMGTHALHIRDPKYKERTYFLIACGGGMDAVVGKYLDFRKFDDETLFQGLHAACEIGDEDTVNLLLTRCKLDPNKASTAGIVTVDFEKNTLDMGKTARYPIAIAANEGKRELVGYFLSYQGIKIFHIFSESYTTDLDQFVVACMGGEGFLPLVEAYIQIGETKREDIYQAIYLASRFGNDEAVRLIIEKYHESLDDNLVSQLIDQGYADAQKYLSQPANKSKSKIDKQRDAVTEMRSKFASIVGHAKLEHSSDEERLSDSGSRSPGHSSDSDKEPQSANSDNSPPSSPPKPAMPAKPLSEKAKRLLAKFCVDQAMSLAVSIEVQKEICDQGLTFTWFRDNQNVFHEFVLLQKFEIASYILGKYLNAVNSKNPEGRTALHLRLYKEFSAQTSFGAIASFAVTERSYLEVVNYLLANGADPTLTDNDGNTPLFYAEKNNFNNIAAVLKQHMPKQVSSLPQPSVMSPALEARPIVVSRPVKVASLAPATASPASTLATNSNSASPAMFRPAPQPQSISYAPPPPALKSDVRVPANNSSIISQPPVKTASSEQYKDKQKSSGFKSMLKSIIPGSSSDDKKDKKEKKGALQLSH